MRQFNIRQLLAATAMVGVVLMIVRRPILWLIQQGDTTTGMLAAFLDPFRHLAWLFGFEVQYFNALDNGTFFEWGVSCVAIMLSVVVHVGLAITLFMLFRSLWRWACTPPPPVEHPDPYRSRVK